MTLSDGERLRRKRRELVEILYNLRQERLRFFTDNPDLDVSAAEVLDVPLSREAIARDVARLSESYIDEILEHYSGASGPRYVW
jgi:hypothetical protein